MRLRFSQTFSTLALQRLRRVLGTLLRLCRLIGAGLELKAAQGSRFNTQRSAISVSHGALSVYHESEFRWSPNLHTKTEYMAPVLVDAYLS